ncbi:translation initiation factor IF-2 [Patescibacteria group bacterium]|nr:translation initiation factor IF-2 [Patescibacteria group bacterium]MBU4512322.1 translation initiation factor IF-2 [Patescibacteria group bacterium]MCG2693313.1 translation initiation factor IF-2 [Candidatus Parcubacteria bacterium]
MNITELARQLKIPTQELREKLPELGFDIGMRAIKVDDGLIDKIAEAWNQNKRLEKAKKEREDIRRVEVGEGAKEVAEESAKKVVHIPEAIIVHDLAEKIGLPVSKVIIELMKNGFMATINESIDFETAAIIADDLGIAVERGGDEETEVTSGKTAQDKLEKLLKQDKKESQETRPPVVVVMGHVDHGKTSLLDAIRKTNVAGKEAGAITQHIGAYQVNSAQGRTITFIDTPGHEAFKAMRARGGVAADIAILVVAADDGVRPQTLESIKVVQGENLPFIVAINKIDKEEADIDRVKKELSEINLSPEDWGGKTICVPVSATTKQGLEELMEMILLIADMEKEKLKADPKREAVGTVIETRLDKNEGPVATILIHTGTLRLGDAVIAGKSYGTIKALRDFQKKPVKTAVPSMPVEVLGLKTTPQVGDILEVVADKKFLKQKIKQGSVDRNQGARAVHQTVDKEQPAEDSEINNLNLVLRADKLGSLEAIVESIEQAKYEEVNVAIVKRGLGNITEPDILQAESSSENSKALVIGFNVGVNPGVEILAQEKKVALKVYKVIYELLDDIKKNLETLLTPERVRIDLGELKILEVFREEPSFMIVGGRVTKGKIVKYVLADVVREGQVLGSGSIKELQSNKQEVTEAKSGKECGIKFESKTKVEVGDLLEVYRIEERVKTLK